ncbi:hypothetical protein GCM10022419_115360 [Nonomuraea rosea]|uniref:SHOCT domain-containing protein n=1 Tax=Nonomuraea rosea TaxID=638574 RepID=A0ABP6ZK46_9ACTN
MGLLFRRRRPLRNAAMLAGAGVLAYQAGKHNQAADGGYDEYGQDQGAAEGSGAGSGSMADELERLKALLDQGAITRAEYRAAKQQLLSPDA